MVVTLLVAGCSSGTPPRRLDRPPATDAAAASSSAATGLFAAHTLRSYVIRKAGVYHLSLDGGFLAFTARSGHQADPGADDEVNLLDLTTGKVRVVGGLSMGPLADISWVELTGSHLIWAEGDHIPDDQHPNSAWRLISLDLRTNTRAVLAASRGQEEFSPLPRARYGLAAWVQDTGTLGQLVVENLHTGARSKPIPACQCAAPDIASPNSVTLGMNVRGRHDVYAISLDGQPRPRRISTSGQASYPRAQGGWVTWFEPFNGDPQSEWVAPLDGHAPPKQIGGPSQGNTITTATFTAWLSDGLEGASNETGQTFHIADRADAGPRPSASGDKIAYGVNDHPGDPNEQTTIYIAQVGT